MEERKMYNTRQRSLVLACFSNQPQRSMAAQEVCAQLSQNGETIGRTTIYRTIAKLLEEGLLFRVNEASPTSSARYQFRGKYPRSISVRCSNCGLVAALTCEAVGAFEQHLSHDHGFTLQGEECILPGLCSSCQKTTNHSNG